MAVDTQQILDEAEKLAKMVADHPATTKYQQAHKAIIEDPDASRLLGDFERQLDALMRQEQTGMSVTDAQRRQLESLQMQIASHIKIKALNMAQVDFVDLLRKINQIVQRPLGGEGAAVGGPRLARPQ